MRVLPRAGVGVLVRRALVAVALAASAFAVGPVEDARLSADPAVAARTAHPAGATAAQSYPLPRRPSTLAPAPQPLQLISPFPIVRIVGRLTTRGARIRLLSIRAPASATILVQCRRRGCDRFSEKRGRGIGRPVRFREFERSMRAGTILEVLVERVDAIGKFTRFRIRRGRRPARKDLCLQFGEGRGSPCPEA